MKYFVKPWAHQLEAIEKSKATNNLALFWEMGTGKTATTINILRHKYQEMGGVMPTLILAPIVVLENWAEEIKRHAGPDYEKYVIVLKGTKNKKEKMMAEAARVKSRIIIANYECMQASALVNMMYEFSPRIIDNFQVYLRELRVEDLRGSAGIYRLREELLARVNTAVHPTKVRDVLFRDVLVQ